MNKIYNDETKKRLNAMHSLDELSAEDIALLYKEIHQSAIDDDSPVRHFANMASKAPFFSMQLFELIDCLLKRMIEEYEILKQKNA